LWFEKNPEKDHGDMTQHPTGVKTTQLNQLYCNRSEYWAENRSIVEVAIIETPCSSREESE